MMKQFNSDGKYWDVQIRIDEEVFKCQRSLLAAHSKYFDTMFNSINFEEFNAKADQPITLHGMYAPAFGEILNFMYTGYRDICILDSNVFQLLVMSDFLQLNNGLVKELCLRYVGSRFKTCDDPKSYAPGLLCFVHLKGESVLVDTLRAHICRHLYHYYSENAQLMEISSEILNSLLDEFSKNYIIPLPGSADILLKIVLKWINHNREGRSQYRSNLMKNIDFGRISPNFSRSLMNGLENVLDKVVNLSKDIESLSELKMSAMEMDTNFTIGDAQFDETFSVVLENVIRKGENNQEFSSSFTISNLSWKIRFTVYDFSSMYTLFWLRTDLCSVWNCYTRTKMIVKSQKEGKEDYAWEFGPVLFSSDKGRFSFPMFPNVDLFDPRHGFIKDDGSITLVAHVHADVPFLQKFIV